jgi:hypothetical protein
MFFALLFLEDECRGILFLSPEDEALIRSLPDFNLFSIGLGKKGIRSRAVPKDSMAAKLSKNLFLWDDANKSSMQNQLMDCVTLFLSKPNNRKHSLKEFSAMIPYVSAVELQYITRFIQLFPSAIRTRDRAFGDMTITLGNININVELKLVALDHLQYSARVFRSHHSLADCVNLASVVAFVVLNSEETSKEERASEPSVYKYEVHINLTVHM